MLELWGAVGAAAAIVALLGHVVITLREIRAHVRKIEEYLEDQAEE